MKNCMAGQIKKKIKRGLYFGKSKETRNLTNKRYVKGKDQKILINVEDIKRVFQSFDK